MLGGCINVVVVSMHRNCRCGECVIVPLATQYFDCWSFVIYLQVNWSGGDSSKLATYHVCLSAKHGWDPLYQSTPVSSSDEDHRQDFCLSLSIAEWWCGGLIYNPFTWGYIHCACGAQILRGSTNIVYFIWFMHRLMQDLTVVKMLWERVPQNTCEWLLMNMR